MPLDEPSAVLAISESIHVGGKVLLLVVGVVVGNEMTGVGVAVVEITDDKVNDKSVESVVVSVTVAGSLNCRVWIHRSKVGPWTDRTDTESRLIGVTVNKGGKTIPPQTK